MARLRRGTPIAIFYITDLELLGSVARALRPVFSFPVLISLANGYISQYEASDSAQYGVSGSNGETCRFLQLKQ